MMVLVKTMKELKRQVKNLPDGSVEAGVTCHNSKLDYFINLLKQGSQYSEVDSVEMQESQELFSGDFEIR